MASWAKICEIFERYAIRTSEMDYQKSIIDLLLENKLGWHKDQIVEQFSMPIGSRERLVPDILVSKDCHNKFVMEVKKPSHVKSQRDIDQLVSYMKQLETPVGIYVGKELDVYYKTIGEGTDSRLVLSLEFTPNDENGEKFVSLFMEADFSIDRVLGFLKEQEERAAFDANVKMLRSYLLSHDFQNDLKIILTKHFSDKGENVVREAMSKLKFDISVVNTCKESDSSSRHPLESAATYKGVIRKKRKGKTANRYAYNLIKKILEKNPDLGFDSLYAIFGHKNFIEIRTRVNDENRWFMADEDVLIVGDGTQVVVSNQWGFNGNCEKKMDFLREIARKFDIGTD